MQTLRNLASIFVFAMLYSAVVSAQVTVQCPSLPCTITVTAPLPPPIPTAKFSAGDRIITTAAVNVRSSGAISATILGVQLAGALGTITGGGVKNAIDGVTWWTVNYDTGADGWSGQDNLVKSSAPPVVVVHGVALSWQPSISPGVTYTMYRSETSGGPYGLNTSAPIIGTSYVDPSAVSGKTYYYVVVAVSASGGQSVYSNEAKVTMP